MAALLYIASYDSSKQTFDYVASLPIFRHDRGQRTRRAAKNNASVIAFHADISAQSPQQIHGLANFLLSGLPFRWTC